MDRCFFSNRAKLVLVPSSDPFSEQLVKMGSVEATNTDVEAFFRNVLRFELAGRLWKKCFGMLREVQDFRNAEESAEKAFEMVY